MSYEYGHGTLCECCEGRGYLTDEDDGEHDCPVCHGTGTEVPCTCPECDPDTYLDAARDR